MEECNSRFVVLFSSFQARSDQIDMDCHNPFELPVLTTDKRPSGSESTNAFGIISGCYVVDFEFVLPSSSLSLSPGPM